MIVWNYSVLWYSSFCCPWSTTYSHGYDYIHHGYIYPQQGQRGVGKNMPTSLFLLTCWGLERKENQGRRMRNAMYTLVAQLVNCRIHLQCKRPRFEYWVRKICWRRVRLPTPVFLGFPCGSAGKEYACNAGDRGSIPRLGRSPGEGKGYPLQYSGL